MAFKVTFTNTETGWKWGISTSTNNLSDTEDIVSLTTSDDVGIIFVLSVKLEYQQMKTWRYERLSKAATEPLYLFENILAKFASEYC